MSSNIHRLLLERNRQNISTYELIKANGIVSIRAKRSKDLVAHLAKVVAGQQLSTKAADSIWKKIETLLEENNCSIEELFLAKPAALRASSGLSRNKVKAISGMVEIFESGQISKQMLFKKNYDDLVECITSLFGVSGSGRPIWLRCLFSRTRTSGQTVISRSGRETLSGGNEKTKNSILSASAPYRSYLARHIWKGFNRGLL